MAHVEPVRCLLATPPTTIEFARGQSRDERLDLIRRLSPEATAAVLSLLEPIVAEGYGVLDAGLRTLEHLMAAPYRGSAGYVLSEDWRLRVYASEKDGAVYVFTGWPGDVPMGGAVYCPPGGPPVEVFEHQDGSYDCSDELDEVVGAYWERQDSGEGSGE